MRVVAVVVCVNARALQIGRHEAGDDGTKLVKSSGAVQERLCEKGQWMYRTVVVVVAGGFCVGASPLIVSTG